MISYKGWKIVWLFIYIQIKCKKNKSLVLCVDQLMIRNNACDHVKINIEHLHL